MNFEEALRNELNSIPELANKVFPLTAIEGVKTPYLVYVSSDGVQEKCLNGYAGSKEVDCELHILNDSYSGLKDITREVISLVVSFQNRVIGGTDGIWIQDITYEKVTEQYIDQLFQYLCVLSVRVRL
jgi:hypothetical protein